jgi:hypothetical protein
MGYFPMILLVVLLAYFPIASLAGKPFNNEVLQERVLDRLVYYLGDPVATNELLFTYRENDGFANDMLASDRDAWLKLGYSLPLPLVYYGLEDGTCLG